MLNPRGRGGNRVFGGGRGAGAGARPVFDQLSDDDRAGSAPRSSPRAEDQRLQGRSPRRSPILIRRVEGSPTGSRHSSPGRAQQHRVASSSLPVMSVDGRFGHEVVQRSHSGGGGDPTKRPAPPRFAESDDPMVTDHRAGSPSAWATDPYVDGKRDVDIVHSRRVSPTRFDRAPQLGSAAEEVAALVVAEAAATRDGVAVSNEALFGGPSSAAAKFQAADGKPGSPPGFRRAVAPRAVSPRRTASSPTKTTWGPSPRKAALSVVSVEALDAAPTGSTAPRLRTAERSRMSPVAQRKSVHVTAAATGRQAQLESEVERLQRAVSQRDAQLASLEMDNQRLREEAREANLRQTALMEQYRKCHASLEQALDKLRGQQRDIERLQGALVGESTDNDTLRHGFSNLLRSAQAELKHLRDEAAARDRAEWYMRPH